MVSQIKKQFLLTFIVIFIISCTVSTVSIVSFIKQDPVLKKFEEDINAVINTDIELLKLAKDTRTYVIQVQQWLTDISATRGLDGLNDGFDEAQNNAEAFNRTLEEMSLLVQEQNYKEISSLIAQMREAFPPYYQVGQKMAQSYVNYGPEGGNPMMGQFDEVAAKISELAEQLVEKAEKKSGKKTQDLVKNILHIEQQNSNNEMLIIGLTIVSIIVIIAASLYMFSIISCNFKNLSADIDDISNRNLEGDVHLNPESQTEFGHVARALQQVKEALRQAEKIAEDKKLSEARAEKEKKQAMQELADNFETRVQSIINTVSSASTQLYSTAESMGDAIGNACRKADSVAASSGETSHNVQSVASAAEEMSASVKEISHQILRSTSAVEEAVSEMGRAETTSQMLEEATSRIGEIVSLIQDIAGQINLLALNATIESARAGEAGKGFAVVASEVKNLAGQTSKATDDISVNISSVQDVAAQVITVLHTIKSSISNIHEVSSAIASAVEEQTAVTNEIAQNMNFAATGTNKINQDIDEVTQASNIASDAAVQTLNAAKTLSEEAASLNNEVAAFLAEIRAG